MPIVEIRQDGRLIHRTHVPASDPDGTFLIALPGGRTLRLSALPRQVHGSFEVVLLDGDDLDAGEGGSSPPVKGPAHEPTAVTASLDHASPHQAADHDMSLSPAQTIPPTKGRDVPEHSLGSEGTLSRGAGQPQARSADKPDIPGFRVTGLIGQGGMGTVWRARQEGTERDVALKVMTANRFASPKAQARFEREVQLSASLSHPGIVRVFESGTQAGLSYYAMEFIKGRTLEEHVKEHGLGTRQILTLMQSVARAVQHAHQCGVIHRDLKPSNVLVDDEGWPHLLDFGLARALETEAGGLSVTTLGDVAGTPGFMAPEQASGRADLVDTRTDVYALGTILYRLMVGQPPHDLSGSTLDVLRRVAEEDVPRPRLKNPGLDKELESLLLKALSREPDGRYASAGDLADDIENYLKAEPLTARRQTTWYFLRKRLWKHRVAVAVAGLVAAVLVTVAVVAYAQVRRERDTAQRERRRAVDALALAQEREAEARAARRREEQERAQAASAREGEASALTLAKGHREEAARQRELALRREREARALAKQTKELGATVSKVVVDSRRQSYARQIQSVHAQYRQNNLDRAREELHACPGPMRSWEWRYLEAALQPPTAQTLFRPGQHVGRIVGTPDRTRLIVVESRVLVGRLARVHVVEAATGRTLRVFDAHAMGIMSVAISGDGKTLATYGKDNKANVWDLASGRLRRSWSNVKTLKIACAVPVALTHTGTHVAWLDADNANGRLHVCEVATGREIARAKAIWARDLFFLPGTTDLLIPTDEGLMVYDGTTGKVRRKIAVALPNRWRRADITPDGRWAATSDWHRRLKVWDLAAGKAVRTIQLKDVADHVALSPDGKVLASVAMRIPQKSPDNRPIRVWDVASGEERASLWLRGRPIVTGLEVANDGRTLWAAEAGEVHLLPMRSPTAKLVIPHAGKASTITFSRDGRSLVVLAPNRIAAWSVPDLRMRQEWTGLRLIGPQALAISASGRWIAAGVIPSGSAPSSVALFDVKTGSQRPVRTRVPARPVTALAFEADKPILAIACKPSVLELVDVEENRPEGSPVSSGTEVSTMCFLAGSRGLLVSRHTPRLNVQPGAMDIRSVPELRSQRSLPLALAAHAAMSPDGRWLALVPHPLAGIQDWSVALHDGQTGELVWSALLPSNRCYGLGFTADSQRLICAGRTSIQIRDITSGLVVLELVPARGNVSAFAVDPSGNWLAALTDVGTIELWGHASIPSTGTNSPSRPAAPRP